MATATGDLLRQTKQCARRRSSGHFDTAMNVCHKSSNFASQFPWIIIAFRVDCLQWIKSLSLSMDAYHDYHYHGILWHLSIVGQIRIAI